MSSDIPTGLTFVNPAEVDPTYRVVLWAEPGAGKSVAAASAPTPILALSADRPSAYRFARKHHGLSDSDLREVRYEGPQTLAAVYQYLSGENDIRTVIVDPVGNIYDQLAEVAPIVNRGDGPGPDYQWVNKKLLGFIKSLRRFDVNVVLVAHEKLNDGKKGDGKMYPHLGGGTLINKTLAEMDIVAHIERVSSSEGGEETVRWAGQIQPVRNLVTKDGTGSLGDRRIADLTRWFEVANEALAPDVSDLPWEQGTVDEDEADTVDQGTLDEAALLADDAFGGEAVAA